MHARAFTHITKTIEQPDWRIIKPTSPTEVDSQVHMEEAITTIDPLTTPQDSDNITRTLTMATQPLETSLEVTNVQRYPGRQETITGGGTIKEGLTVSCPHDSSSEDEGSLKQKVKELTATCHYITGKVKQMDAEMHLLKTKAVDQHVEIQDLKEQLAAKQSPAERRARRKLKSAGSNLAPQEP
jgi:hypothetical protein